MDGKAGTKSPNSRNTLLLEMINPESAANGRHFDTVAGQESVSVSADEHLSRISDNVAAIAAS
jgi:hypothetical protein